MLDMRLLLIHDTTAVHMSTQEASGAVPGAAEGGAWGVVQLIPSCRSCRPTSGESVFLEMLYFIRHGAVVLY